MSEEINWEKIKDISDQAGAVIALYAPWIVNGGKVLLEKAKDKVAEAAISCFGRTCKVLWRIVRGELSDSAPKALEAFELNPEGENATVLRRELERLLTTNARLSTQVETMLEELRRQKDDLPGIDNSFNGNHIVNSGDKSPAVIGSGNQISIS